LAFEAVRFEGRSFDAYVDWHDGAGLHLEGGEIHLGKTAFMAGGGGRREWNAAAEWHAEFVAAD